MTTLQMAVSGFEVLCAAFLLWRAVAQLTRHCGNTWYAVSLSWILTGGYSMWVITNALSGAAPEPTRSLLIFVVTLAIMTDRRGGPRRDSLRTQAPFGRAERHDKRDSNAGG